MKFFKLVKIVEQNETEIHLWLDDNRDPRDDRWKSEKGSTGNEIWVKTAPEAIEIIKSGKVKSISLDHDLGLFNMDDINGPAPGKGIDVAKAIEELAYYNKIPRLTWKIHTENPVGRKQMEQALTRADEFWQQHEAKVNRQT